MNQLDAVVAGRASWRRSPWAEAMWCPGNDPAAFAAKRREVLAED